MKTNKSSYYRISSIRKFAIHRERQKLYDNDYLTRLCRPTHMRLVKPIAYTLYQGDPNE